VSGVGYGIYGDCVADSLVKSMEIDWIKITISVLLSIHLIVSYVIVVNPVAQDIEDAVGVPTRK